MLGLFNRNIEDIYCLSADNCNTNKSVAKILGINFIGCSSHRFNLAMEQFLEKEKGIIDKINTVMKKLKQPSLAARLRCSTKLVAKTNCPTRWSSTYEMVQRYLKLEPFLDNDEYEEIEEHILSSREIRKAQRLCEIYLI